MQKQIIILFILAFALGIGLFFVLRNPASEIKQRDAFMSFEQDSVYSFEVNHFTLGMLFKKIDGVWHVKRIKNELVQRLEKEKGVSLLEEDNDFSLANIEYVSKAITYLFALPALHPISKGGGDPAQFEINEHSLHIKLYDIDNREIERISVGKTGPDIMSSFIKRAGSKEVFLAQQDFRQLFLKGFEEWKSLEKMGHDQKE
ncbi:MAG: DUF4340 domain-containing protein [bacterium]|nr:DUF4340 domain-containing protein [bacterium]MBU1917037.1 DUF4340 domain-containing protein [bacterium]